MKLKFKNQQFQTDAVDSVADLFKGQEKLRSTFEITNIEAIDLINQNELGIGNVISISNDALLANMHEIQRRNNLPMTNDIVDDEGAAHRSFCVEMETGTGKTYVYTKTIFELNKRYGFTKFIIVAVFKVFLGNLKGFIYTLTDCNRRDNYDKLCKSVSFM